MQTHQDTTKESAQVGTDTEAILEVKNLVTSFSIGQRQFNAVDDCSFKVKRAKPSES